MTPERTVDYEKSLLGVLWFQPALWARGPSSLRPSDFLLGTHSALFEAIAELNGKGQLADRAGMLEYLDLEHDSREVLHLVSHWISCGDGAVPENIAVYVAKIKQASEDRKLVEYHRGELQRLVGIEVSL